MEEGQAAGGAIIPEKPAMAMRTSGASSDPIYYIPAIVAIGAVILLFGGPHNLMIYAEQALRALVVALRDLYQSIAG